MLVQHASLLPLAAGRAANSALECELVCEALGLYPSSAHELETDDDGWAVCWSCPVLFSDDAARHEGPGPWGHPAKVPALPRVPVCLPHVPACAPAASCPPCRPCFVQVCAHREAQPSAGPAGAAAGRASAAAGRRTAGAAGRSAGAATGTGGAGAGRGARKAPADSACAALGGDVHQTWFLRHQYASSPLQLLASKETGLGLEGRVPSSVRSAEKALAAARRAAEAAAGAEAPEALEARYGLPNAQSTAAIDRLLQSGVPGRRVARACWRSRCSRGGRTTAPAGLWQLSLTRLLCLLPCCRRPGAGGRVCTAGHG